MPTFDSSSPAPALADVAVVVPARNAEGILDACLASVVASRPAALVVVDGMSTDATVEIALRHGATVISDEGAGLPAARLLGAGAVQQNRVALIDADVVLTDGALEALADEHRAGNYVGLQASLESTGGPGYWGRALAMHHRTGLSRGWFGLVATVFTRDKLLEYGFDDVFSSGEDMDIRWRLTRNGERIGVFEDVVVEHRFAGDNFAFACDQWRMDGYGLGQMARSHGLRGVLLVLLPLAAAVRGIGLSLLRLQPEWVVYYLAYAVGNYASMARALLPERLLRAGRLVENAMGLLVSKGAAMGCGFLFWLLAAHATVPHEVGLAAGVIAAMMLCTQLAILGVGAAVITVTSEQRRPTGAVLDAAIALVAMLSLAVGVGALGVLAQLPRFANLQNPLFAACFVLLVVLGTLNILLDHVAVSFGRGRKVALRGAVAGGVPLLPLLVPGLMTDASASALVALWVPGLLLSCIGGWRLVRRELPVHTPTWRSVGTGLLVELLRHGVPNWALTLSDRVPGPLLAVLVTQLLSPTDNAHWYIVWMAAWVVYAVPNSVGIALFAEVARYPDRARPLARRGLRLSLGLGLAGAAAAAIVGPALLRMLGASYADEGVMPLLVLLIGVVPLSVLQVRYAVCRATSRLAPAVVTGVCTAVGGLVLAATVGVSHGLTGIALCWVATLSLAAVASVVLVRPVRAAKEIVDDDDVPSATVADARPPDHIGASTATRASLLMVIVAGVLWVTAAANVDLRRMNDLGLASVLTARMWIAFGLLCLAMTVALLDRRPPHWILALNVVVLCACFFGLSSWLYDIPRGAVAFRHAGITQAMIDAGAIDRSIDAYFDWPGFFTLAASVSKVAGLSDPIALARWAPLVVNLMCIPPLLLLIGALTQDRRRVWLAVWLFCALDWINQDYFSPQSFGYLLYLCVLALLVTLFRPSRGKVVPRPGGVVSWLDRFNAAHRGNENDLQTTPRPDQNRPAAVLLVLLLCAALVPSHQLTPFALLTVVTALVLLRRCTLTSLPFLLLILIVLWDGYVALPYISGHAHEIFGSVGDVQNAASANIANRVAGSADHIVVVRVRLVLTFVVWGLAALASLVQWRRRRVDRTAQALAWSPLLLVLAQPYGGEMLLRVFWFTLPGTALLLASIVLPGPRVVVRPRLGVRPAATMPRRQRPVQVVRWSGLALLLTGLLGASFVARYGNERMDQFTAAELQGTRAMYDLAPPNALVVAGAGSFPWKNVGYVDHKYLEVDRSWVPGDLAATAHLVAQRMRAYPYGAVLVITTSQQEEVNMLGLLPAQSLEGLAREVNRSREFESIYRNRDVQVWQACGAKEATC